MKLEKIADCIWKKMVEDKGTTFKDVKQGHKLYSCVDCSGEPGSCPDYNSYNRLRDKYGR